MNEKKKIEEKEEDEQQQKKKKKGFTLIELLAVIIILGILMIIAIPSVTNYISNSRKSAYVDTAKEIVSGTRNVVNSGKLGMYDTNTTYYIPASYIKTENASKSPYGEFVEAYVVVIYDGKGYSYYWISVDDAGQGVKGIISVDKLEEDNIESDIKPSDIQSIIESTGIGSRNEIKILNPDTNEWRPIHLDDISGNISEAGGEASGSGSGSESGGCSGTCVCRRATTLHTETCSGRCSVAVGVTTTYGSLGTVGEYNTGDAYDCDVNGDGVYNAQNERFYYIKSDGNYSILLYYSNVRNNGTPSLFGNMSYDEYLDGYSTYIRTYNGPLGATGKITTANTHYSTPLPSTSKWSNVRLRSTTRAIKGPNGETSIGGHTLPTAFSYNGLAARLLTYQEFNSVCGGEKNCTFAVENTSFGMELNDYDDNDGTGVSLGNGNGGWWLETPSTVDTAYVVTYWSGATYISPSTNDLDFGYGFRPAIEVPSNKVEK